MTTPAIAKAQSLPLTKLPNVEDIYPVSPMQQGMLFHGLYQPESQMYFIQVGCHFEQGFSVRAFQRAWEEVVGRHSVLRTNFLWEGLKEPVQVVRRKVQLPWREEDWRLLEEAEQKRKWKEFVRLDRCAPFHLNQAPLTRFALLRTSEDGYYFLWSYHHILLDGWCQQIIMREMFTFYQAFRDGSKVMLEKPRPYRDYIGWLQKLDESRAESFWREELKGFT
ncbi:MAG TPA: condensation domain-containing protein, partial [Candidatus Angelobacter sp.]